jgi:hypothetical protein
MDILETGNWVSMKHRSPMGRAAVVVFTGNSVWALGSLISGWPCVVEVALFP